MQRRKTFKSNLVRITLATLLIAGMAFAPFASAQAPATVTLMVKLSASMSAADRQALMDRYGATVKSDINKLGIEVVEIPADNAATAEQNMRQEPGVLRVEESKTRRVQALPNDAQVGSQWALPQIAWDQVYGSVNPQFLTKVAILDTGVEATHTDLMGSLAAGTSIIDGSGGLTDLNGHGTWLAGIVAAQTNNIDGIAGVGYQNVQVMPVKVADANGDAQDDDVVSGVMWATDNGASVILMAFSNTGFSDSLQDAIDYAWANNVVLVAAVGNDGSNTATFPAGDRGVMGVSATDQSDNLASGSNYGGSVFLAAPGVNILGTGLNNSYVALSGTSASAAIVAGAAALMRAVDPTLTNGVVVNRLAKNADPAGTQDQTGNGRLQIARAIADTDTTSIQPAGTAPVGGGGPFVGPYHVAASHTLTGVLAPGSQVPNPVVRGNSATFLITVTFGGSGNACNANLTVNGTLPTGVTAAFDHAVSSGGPTTATLTFTTTGTTPAGSTPFTVTATENPAGNCSNTGPFTSPSANLVVVLPTPTATTLVSGTNPSVYGGSVTFTATITPAVGSVGTVTFKDGGATICNAVPLSSSQAQCSTSTLSATGSPRSMTAVYSGGTGFLGSSSNALSQTVTQKALTAAGTLAASNRIYDATTNATLTGSAALQTSEAFGAGTSVDGKPYTGDAVIVTGTPTGTFASANVANGINVSVTGLSLTGGAAGNYTVTQPTLSANITAKALTISGSTASGRVYDGTTVATLGGTPALLAAEAPGAGTTADGKPYTADSVSAGGTAAGAFADRNVGANKSVTVSGVTIAGTGSGNYTATQQTGLTATITAKALTISGATASAKIYDGTATATLGGAPALLATEAAGSGTTADGKPYSVDAVSAANTDSGSFADRNVGTAKPITVTGVTITGTGNGNYTATQQTGLTADITPKALTVVGSTAGNKVYDGTTAATLGGTPALLVAETAGTGTTVDGKPYTIDTVTTGGTAAGSFADRNVGNAKPVTVTGVTIGGADNGNYTVTQQTGLTANITAKALTYTGLSAPPSRIYDGTTAAVVSGTAVLQATEAPGAGTTADGIPYSADSVSLAGTATGTYNTKDVLTATTVTFGGISLTGTGNGNYTLTASTQAATITKKALTMSGLSVPASKIYNGTTAAVVSGSPGSLQGAEASGSGTSADGKPYSGDTVSLTGTATGTYDTKDVATASTVTFGGVSLTGAQSGDYTLTIQSPAAATITAKNLTITGSSASAKIYDGTTAETLGGAPALQAAEAAGTGTTADGKPYTGDSVSASNTASGTFVDRNVGNAKPVTVIGVAVAGPDSGNYTATQQAGLTANITAKALAIAGSTASAKGYDGTTTETLGGTPALQAAEATGTGTTSDGIPYTVDSVSVSGTASGAFADRNVGVAKPVTVSGVTITGTGSGNYTVTQQAGLTADITAKALTISGSTAAARIYNATTVEALGGTPALLSTEPAGSGTTSDGKPYAVDSVSASNTDTGAFADANVGVAKPVTVTGVTITGTGNGNYTATQQTGLTADITAKALTVAGVSASDKTYDATTNATLTGTAALQTAEAPGAGTGVDGKPYAGDAVSVSGTPTGTFASKNVGSGINVTISGLTLAQPASNYTLTAPTDTANITKKALTVAGLTANDKTYDTNTNATLSGTAALQAAEAPGAGSTADGIPYTGDTVSVTGTPSGTFASANAGANINVNVTGLSLSGAQVGNYSLTALTLTATINKATANFSTPLTSPAAIPYGTATVSLSPNSPMILVGGNRVSSPDTVTITVNGVSSAPIPFNGGSGTFGPINFDTHLLPVGSYPITYLYSGNANVNSLTDTSTALTVSKKSVTPSVTANDKTYDGNNSATIAPCTVAVKVGSDDVACSAGSATFASSNASAVAQTVTATGITLTGTTAGNYSLITTTAATTAKINKAALTYTASGSKTYGSTTDNSTASGFSGFQNSENAGTAAGFVVPVCSSATGAVAGAVVGTYTIDCAPGSATNYTLAAASFPNAFTVNPASSATTISCPTSATYTGAAQTPCTATATGAGGLSASVPVTYGNNTNGGTATADATYAGDANHNGSTATQVTFAITPAASSTTISCPASVTYTGTAQTPCMATATGVGGLSVSVSVTYGNNTEVGTATADATYAGDSNHNGSTATQATFAITKATSTTTVMFEAGPYGYRGTPFTASATATGVGGLNTPVAVVYSGDCTNVTVANGCTATATFAGDTDHTGSSDAKSITIIKANATWITNDNSKIYGEFDPVALTTGSGSGFLLSDGVTATYTRPLGEAIGGYHITAALSATGSLSNYNITNAGGTFAILPRPATWTTNDNSKAFGDADPNPVTTGSGSGFLAADGVTATYSRASGEAVGTYHIDATLSSTTSALGNYSITNAGATFTINKYTIQACSSAGCGTTGQPAKGGSVTISSGAAYLGSATATVTLTPYAANSANLLNQVGGDTTTPSFAVYLWQVDNSLHSVGSPVLFGSGKALPTGSGPDGYQAVITANLTSDIGPGTYEAFVYGDDGATLTSNLVTADAGYTGTDLTDYNYPTLTSSTLTVTKADQTITFNALSDKTYGDASFAVSATASSSLAATFASTTTGVCTTSGTNGSMVTLIAAGSCSIKASQAGNDFYNAAPDVTRSVTVNTKSITATLTASDKIYNGNNTEPNASMSCSLTGVVPTDNGNVSCAATSGTFNTSDVLTANQVTATATISGTAAGNYTFGAAGTTATSTSATATAHITPATVTAAIIGNPTKPYDGNTNATLTATNFSLTGVASGESFTVTKTTGSYNSKDVAAANTVTTSLAAGDFTAGAGTSASNYTLPTTASGAGHITAVTVTAAIIGNPTKPYDSNTDATLTAANFSLSGLVGSESFTVTQTSGTYNSPLVPSANTVTSSLAGTDFTPTGGAVATNYTLPTSASGPGHITPKPVTPSIIANNKVYTGNTDATTSSCTVAVKAGSDGNAEVACAVGSASFADANAGMGKVVTASGIALTGTKATSYSLTTTSATALANIDKAHLTVTADDKIRVFGQANPTFTATITGFVNGENPISAGVSGTPTFSGTGPSSTATTVPGLYVITPAQGGLAAANYDFTPFVDGHLMINKADATTTITSDDPDPSVVAQTYTVKWTVIPVAPGAGTPSGTVTVTVDGGAGCSAAVGAGQCDITPTLAGSVNLKAAYAGDGNFNGSASGNEPHTINKRSTSTAVSFSPDPVVYGGSTTATVTVTDTDVPTKSSPGVGTVVSVVSDSGDTITGTCTLAADTASTSKCSVTVAPTHASLHGITATFSATATHFGSASSNTTYTVNPKPITATLTAADKTYDGNTTEPDETMICTVGVLVSPDTVTCTAASGTFNASDVASANQVTATVTISGPKAANYTFGAVGTSTLSTSATATAHITKASSTTVVTFEAGPYVYRGTAFTAGANVTGAGGLDAPVAVVYSGDCTNVTVANGCTATANFAGDTNHLTSSDNKSITITQAASVTTVTCPAGPYIYTGSAQTPCSTAITGAGGLSLTPMPSYSNNTNAGTATASYSYTGDANHTGSSDSKTFTIDPAPSVTTVTCPPGPYTYTGSAQTPCSTTVTGAGGLSLTPTPSYSNNTKAGTATASYSYAGDANHTGSSDSKNFTIDRAPLTLTAVTNTKNYDAYITAAATPTVAGLKGTDTVTGLTETYDNRNAGTGKTLSVATYTVNDGNSGNNYMVTKVDNHTGVINKAGLTVTAATNSKPYDGTTTAAAVPTITSGTLKGTDTASFTEAYANPNVGTGLTLIPATTIQDGNGGNNYAVIFVNNTTGVITADITTLVVVSNPTSITFGQSPQFPTFTATVGNVSSLLVPPGTVKFTLFNNSNTQVDQAAAVALTLTVNGDQAQWIPPSADFTVNGGPYTVTAQYLPASANFLTSSNSTTVGTSFSFAYGIFADSAQCPGAINMSGGGTVDSFNSAVGYAGSHQNKFGDVGTNGNLQLSAAFVYGTLYDPNTGHSCPTMPLSASGGGTVLGTQIISPVVNPAPLPPSPAPPTTSQAMSAGNCGTVPGCTKQGTGVAIPPGTYGNLSASGGTAVHVKAGVYNVNSITLSGGSTLVVDSGPVLFNVAGAGSVAINFSGGSIVNASGIPLNFKMLYGGKNSVTLSGGASSYAVVYAPNAPITLSGGSGWYGSIIGSTITVSGGTAIHYDTSLGTQGVQF